MRYIQYYIKDYDKFITSGDKDEILPVSDRYNISSCHDIALKNNGQNRDFYDAYQIFEDKKITKAKAISKIIPINNDIKNINGIEIDINKIYHCVIINCTLKKFSRGCYGYILQYITKEYTEKIFFYAICLGNYKDYKKYSQKQNKILWHLAQRAIKRFGFKFKHLRELDVFGFNFEATLTVSSYLDEDFNRKHQIEIAHIL